MFIIKNRQLKQYMENCIKTINMLQAFHHCCKEIWQSDRLSVLIWKSHLKEPDGFPGFQASSEHFHWDGKIACCCKLGVQCSHTVTATVSKQCENWGCVLTVSTTPSINKSFWAQKNSGEKHMWMARESLLVVNKVFIFSTYIFWLDTN